MLIEIQYMKIYLDWVISRVKQPRGRRWTRRRGVAWQAVHTIVVHRNTV